MKLVKSLIVLLFMLWGASSAHSIHLAQDGQGQALTLPYFTSAGGNDTLLIINNNRDVKKAVKVRVIGDTGEEITSFNLYLNAMDVWTAAITESEGQTVLISQDLSCTLPQLGGQETVLADSAGYMEVIEMARGDESSGEPLELWSECDQLQARWDGGVWSANPNAELAPPSGGISMSGTLIDVEVGGMTTVEATALAGFSDIPQHTFYLDVAPNLGTAHDSGTAAGATASTVCTDAGCRTDTWPDPIDAVAAVLMAKTVTGDVTINPNFGALTEMVVNFPLARFFDSMSTSFSLVDKLVLYDREGNALSAPNLGPCSVGFPADFCLPYFDPDLKNAVSVVSFNTAQENVNLDQQSSILSALIQPTFSLEDRNFKSGRAWLGFEQRGTISLVSNEGTEYSGEPVIGFVVQQFTNGTLIDEFGNRIRANYRSSINLDRRMDVNPIDN